MDPGSRRREGFSGFLIKFCWGDVLMVMASSLSIMSPQFQSHLGGDVENLVGVVCFSRAFSGGDDLRIIVELHRWFILLLRHRNGCGLFDPFGDFPSATNNVRPAQGGAAAAARRRHGLEVEDEGHLKYLVVIFVFVEMFCTVRCFF